MSNNNENIDLKTLPQNLENFSFLREKALEYIQGLASETWTDHNVHDPGITIMEALCYALADAGFRLNFPIQDILADKQAKLPEKAFYHAQEILPAHPTTINDFRKLLIDLPLIKNAWITPLVSKNNDIATDYEKMFVYVPKSKLLTLKELEQLPLSPKEKVNIIKNDSIFISGLYGISIEFETEELLGNIDNGSAFEIILEADIFGEIYYEISNWNLLLNNRSVLQTIAQTYSSNPSKVTLEFEVDKKNKYNNADGKLFERKLKEWYFNIKVFCNNKEVFQFKQVAFIPYLEDKQGISGNDLLNCLTKNKFAFFKRCFEKILALSKAYNDIQSVLNRNRNLAEDYLPQLSAIPTVNFQICADIEVTNQANIEQVQAAIFYAIEQYISPEISFYTYQQMQEKGKTIEEILEGPKLLHGFICEEEMGENSFQNFTINLSDIINAIFEINGFVNIKNIQITLFDHEGKKISNTNKWEIPIPSGHKPILNKRKSKLVFYKNDLPMQAHFRESISLLSLLNVNKFKGLDASIPQTEISPTFRNLSQYFPLANDFPATYKIGRNLPDYFLEDPQYFASKQLEAYLLLFEQIMANFLKDLDQFKDMLSWKKMEHFHSTSTENEWRRTYLLNQSDVNPIWQTIAESENEFLKKRNQSLDYLLSRFAENLQEIDNYFYLTIDNLNSNEQGYYRYLIQLKEQFLDNYINISANRGAAIDIYNPKTYATAPLSGYENRISHLLGCQLLKGDSRKTYSDIKENNIEERGYFHILEHILLRVPKLNDDILKILEHDNIPIELLSICVEDDCTACGGYDPYSFTASLILPSWIKVYSDMYYRDYIEQLIRRETPTTVLLRICWLDQESMKAYEKAIQKWWNAKQSLFHCDSITQTDKVIQYIKAQNEFILILKSQRSDYFPATLHDCKDEDVENNTRVFLNKTILSNPKNK
ncbi:MAG TPA: hypothetical protein VLZ83_03905 [Edaphocola sp.]|nr:hypothetical protein [Edaphocola sp.]